MDEIYRFRSVENLIGKHQELERQEVYFATPEQLNDPMEGYRDIYWKGDQIVWENFLINYLRCVSHIFLLYLVVGESKKLDDSDIPLYPYASPAETPMNKKLFYKIKRRFFSYKYIQKLPGMLMDQDRAIRRIELLTYLGFVQHYAMNSVSDIYFKAGLSVERYFYHEVAEVENAISKLAILPRHVSRLQKQNSHIENLSDKLNVLMDQVRTQHTQAVRYTEMTDAQIRSNKNFLLMELPERFLDKLETLMYPNWYSASFLADCTNSAIWGHYADSHQGICLIFSPIVFENKPSLNLTTQYGYNNSGPMSGIQPHIFKEIIYGNNPVEIDFFRSLGRGPKYYLNHIWYKNQDGDLSICGEHLNDKKDEWHDRYWDKFYKAVTVKFKEWSKEKEYRLIINDMVTDYSDPSTRKLVYDFSQLKGLIFGMKTSVQDKQEIIKIIKEKCAKANHQNFEFFQAEYDTINKEISRYPLNI